MLRISDFSKFITRNILILVNSCSTRIFLEKMVDGLIARKYAIRFAALQEALAAAAFGAMTQENIINILQGIF